MPDKEAAVYRRPRDHYARELLGGRAFVNATWLSNLMLALALGGTLIWTNKVQHDAAQRVKVVVVAYDNAAHPAVLTREWVPQQGDWLEIAGTYARYVRGRPVDQHALNTQRAWVQARSGKPVEDAVKKSLKQQDEDFKADGIDVELVSTVVEKATANAAVVLVRWKERVHKRGGSTGEWKPFNSLVSLVRDPEEAARRYLEQDPQNRAIVFPNPMGIFITHFEPSPEY